MSLTSQQFRKKLHAERPLHRLEEWMFINVQHLQLIAMIHGYYNNFAQRLYSIASKVLGYSPTK